MTVSKSGSGLNMSRRIRRSPYTDRIEQHGVRGFSVVNHMLLPKAFAPTVEEDYWHLREHVQLWDVSTQRQVEIRGPDAARLVQWMSPRDLRGAKVGQCLYVPLVDEWGGMINDPVLLKLADDHFWLSIADSDVLLWAKGLALGAKFDVEIDEPDVSPLAVQGPKAEDLLAKLFGENIRSIGFFKFAWIEFQGTRQLMARSGFSRQGGFEIYLRGGHLGGALWDTIWEAGREFNITPGCPNLIERIEGGLLSYGNEFTRADTPLECGLKDYCSLSSDLEYIGRPALEKLQAQGIRRDMRGVLFDGPPLSGVGIPLPVKSGDLHVGQITSGIWSPRLRRNVGLSMIDRDFWTPGQKVEVMLSPDDERAGEVSLLPFS
ncbi:MAG: dimethylsulfoniopropionate demethylase [Rhizobiaceae bacterium]|nr:dimethylsulfoniopropionate demethylase [Rhizobiaceae bacterium]